jgi:hypothetical protein
VKTYTFNVVIETDEDRWHAYCSALVRQGGATWGNTEIQACWSEEDLRRLRLIP